LKKGSEIEKYREEEGGREGGERERVRERARERDN